MINIRNKDEIISLTREALSDQLSKFDNMSAEEIYIQRKKNFLEIGKQRSFASLIIEDNNLVEKSKIIKFVKQKFYNYKFLVILFFLLMIGFFLIK